MRRYLLTIILLICGITYIQSFDVQTKKLNIETGLPDNNVRSIAQDEKGYIWLGTPNGLYRYDGYSYTVFRYSDDSNMKLLNNNHITAIRMQGQYVIIREQGDMYSLYDTHLNRFVDKPHDEIETMFASKKTNWKNNPLIKPYRHSIIDKGGNVIEDNYGNPVVIDNTGLLWHIDKKTGETIQLRVYDEHLFPLVSSHKYKVCLSADKQRLWVSTNGSGITVYDCITKTTTHIRQSTGLIATDYILDMIIDQAGNVWTANEFHGVICLRTTQPLGENRLLVSDSQELRSNQIYIMHQMPDSTILVANTKGDAWYLSANLSLLNSQNLPLDIHAVCNDPKGVWIGSRQQGLRAPDGRWYRHEENNPSSISANNILFLLRDRDNNIWVAGDNATLDLAVPKNDGTYQFRHFMDTHLAAKVMMQDNEGRIWVGARNGLYSFMPQELKKNGQAYQTLLTAKDTHYSDVSSIFQDSQQRIWIGTIGSGVFIWSNGKFKNITTADGLISNEIQSLSEDNKGNIWIATIRGMTVFNPKDNTYKYIFDANKPLQNRFSDNCVCKLSDGRMAFGTNLGIMVFNSADLKSIIKKDSHLAITKIAINGVAIERMGEDSPLNIAPDDAEELDLAHNQNSLTIECSMFNYLSSLGTQYSFMLEGYDQTWSEPSVYNFVTYKNLPPGRYILHIKAFDDNTQEPVERQFTIIVHSPWWATWWAYIMYLILFCAIGYITYKQLRTVYSLRRRISIEKELTEYKLQFFTNISHEFRTPLTIIRGAIDRMRDSKDIPADMRQPVSNMEHSTNRMLRLINQLLEFRKMQNNKLKLALEDTDIVAFTKDIFLNFSDLAENKQINYTFLPNVKTLTIPIDRQHLDKIIYNLLSNALKYTPAKGSVSVRLKDEGQQVVIRVEDTGVGIPKEKQPELFQRFMQSTFSSDSIGIGLHLTKALVDIHHGKISFEENHPNGSIFIVTLPTDRSIYKPENFIQKSSLSPLTSHVSLLNAPAYKELLPEPMNDRNVMVVEDDADVANFLQQTLSPYFHVDVAIDGQLALERIKEKVPDLIISDIMMPVMDGYELTRRLRSNANTQNIPIVLLTALDAEDKRLKGIKQGADAYITKPFDMEYLIVTCCRLIEQRDKMSQDTGTVSSAARVIAAPEIIVEERDKRLLNAMNLWLDSHISSPTLSVDELAEAMGYNRSNFFKKVKSITGQTPADYIRTLRMNRAAEMLSQETITVSEVCYKVGISDPHYFAKIFKQQFGISPKKYQQGKSNTTL